MSGEETTKETSRSDGGSSGTECMSGLGDKGTRDRIGVFGRIDHRNGLHIPKNLVRLNNKRDSTRVGSTLDLFLFFLFSQKVLTFSG